MKTIIFLVFITSMFASSAIAAKKDIPFLVGHVTDNAEILKESTRRTLTERLQSHEAVTGNQISVLTMPTIGDESIEEYAIAVFESWKLGVKGKDNGVLVIVVPNDRRMRIEVGYGLEGTLTDSMAGQIIRNVMTPRFKEGDYNGGVEAGVQSVIDVLEKGALPEMAKDKEFPVFKQVALNIKIGLSLFEQILIGAFVFVLIGVFTIVGVATPGSGWFLYLFLIPFWATFPIIVIGMKGALILLAIYMIGFPIAKLVVMQTAWYRKAGKDLRKKGRASIGGFTFSTRGSGSSWSSDSSSSSGGSSFSGGGGSSGGGGASGRW
ncbi:MAG: hypothetical protein HW390_1381 [Candidatus Brocadiaceae bacterium]|nr:hypothetical protein [Candidatus Brocadiaceae bacterium]